MDSITSQDDESPPDRSPPSQFTPQSQEIITQRGLTCLICHLVLSLAVQVTCGARFCESCLNHLLERCEPAVCPLCETENPEEKQHITKDEVQPDNFCRNQVKKLHIKCAHHEKGCPWTGLFSQTQTYRDHVQHCSYGQSVLCECGKSVATSELSIHQETECSYHQAKGDAKEDGRPCPACDHPSVNSGDHIQTICQRMRDVETAKRENKAKEAEDGLRIRTEVQPKWGYKMCARLYLNGDGIGKDSHVSLFFVLMKGKYDAILSWPFSRRVTMSLLDQSGNGNHVQEKFRPDPNSSSFQRPRSEMNIATGCPRFIAKADLDRRKQLYIREGAMFIQIVVD